jgi:dTDP-4-dehydrorhamnose reductase
MKILVTGVNGQLGSEIKGLAEDFDQFEFVFTDVNQLDITDPAQIEEIVTANAIQAIINCAAYTAVDKAEDETELATKINEIAVQHLCAISEKHQLKLIHISTDYVFDGTNHKPYHESDEVNPINHYGASKRKGEEIILNSNSESIVIRTSWVYSEFGANFVKTIQRLAKERDELNIISDQIGTPTYARDLAHICLTLLAQNKRIDTHKIFHYSNEGVCSWYDFAREIIEKSGLKCVIYPIESSQYPTKAKRPYYSVLNKSRIKQELNIKIPHWKQSLVTCLSKITKNL